MKYECYNLLCVFTVLVRFVPGVSGARTPQRRDAGKLLPSLHVEAQTIASTLPLSPAASVLSSPKASRRAPNMTTSTTALNSAASIDIGPRYIVASLGGDGVMFTNRYNRALTGTLVVYRTEEAKAAAPTRLSLEKRDFSEFPHVAGEDDTLKELLLTRNAIPEIRHLSQ